MGGHCFVCGAPAEVSGSGVTTYVPPASTGIDRAQVEAAIMALPVWDKRSFPGGFHVNRKAAINAVLALWDAAPSLPSAEALAVIATLAERQVAAMDAMGIAGLVVVGLRDALAALATPEEPR